MLKRENMSKVRERLEAQFEEALADGYEVVEIRGSEATVAQIEKSIPFVIYNVEALRQYVRDGVRGYHKGATVKALDKMKDGSLEFVCKKIEYSI